MKLTSGCVNCFAGLSCSARIEVINLLKQKKQMSVLEIADHFQLSQPTVTHHLQYLKEAQILTSKKVGRQVFYSLNPKCSLLDCGLFS